MNQRILTQAALMIGNDHVHYDHEKRALLAELEAMAVRDADVRTLDEWAHGGRSWDVYRGRFFSVELRDSMRGELHDFEGQSADEARARAAAWAREHSGR